MGKILDLFNERHKEAKMYRESPVNKVQGVNRMKESGEGHPLHYVYPDGEMLTAGGWQGTKLMDSVKDDVVLAEESVSLDRDINRITKFQASRAGGRFFDRQVQLQDANTFVYTRSYRKDNIQDHLQPNVHKPRHMPSASKHNLINLLVNDDLRGEFSHIPGDIGKLQGETTDFLVSSSGPVHLRLTSKGGMLHKGAIVNLSLYIRKGRLCIAHTFHSCNLHA